MTFKYLVPALNGTLLQGEILGNVWEHRPVYPAIEPPNSDSQTPIHSVHHEMMIIMSPACDLNQDFFKARFPGGQITQFLKDPDELILHTHLVPYALLCDAYTNNAHLRKRFESKTLWNRIEMNLDERYHYLEPAQSNGTPVFELPGLYFDFKKVIGIPVVSIYEAIRIGGIKRVAVVPPIYIHQMTQRYFSFLSRVGIP